MSNDQNVEERLMGTSVVIYLLSPWYLKIDSFVR